MDKSKLWPTVITVVPLVTSLFTPAIGDWVSQHPSESMTAYTVLTAIANLIRSPRQG
jgi:hypothetical protein